MNIADDPRVANLCLYAWVGEDEFDGTVGLKQAVVPAGYIPMVAVREDKMLGNKIPEQLQHLANKFGRPIRLVRFAFAEEIRVLLPGVEVVP